jgi:hypothetical protein
MIIKNIKGDLAIGYMGKMIIALVALLVLFYLIGIISGEFGTQGEKTGEILGSLG